MIFKRTAIMFLSCAFFLFSSLISVLIMVQEYPVSLRNVTKHWALGPGELAGLPHWPLPSIKQLPYLL